MCYVCTVLQYIHSMLGLPAAALDAVSPSTTPQTDAFADQHTAHHKHITSYQSNAIEECFQEVMIFSTTESGFQEVILRSNVPLSKRHLHLA